MELPSRLIDPAILLVVDTSVAINLNATGHAEQIVRALPNRILAVDTVQAELEEGRRRGRRDADHLQALVAAELVEIVTLDAQAELIFERLIIGPAAMTLDDGEAATIAYAVSHGAMPIIDDRKATRLCGQMFPDTQVGCTIDLFAHPKLLSALGRKSLAEAVLGALLQARMHVLPQHVEWVLDLIGEEQAALCMSLPLSARRRKDK
jgi:predicted nucleic acid-binding protein